MQHARIGLFMIAALLGSAAYAAGSSDIKVWIPSGAADAAKEKLNKDVVVGGWLQDPGKAHWQNFMVPEFVNHDPDEPRVGAQALVDLMSKGPGAATMAATVPAGGLAKARFFVIADGDYVAIAHKPANFDLDKPTPNVDPGTAIGGNVFHVVNGKITEWWYYAGGRPEGGSAATQPGADKLDVANNSIRPDKFGNTPIAYGVGKLSDQSEARNKQLALEWLQDFWVKQNYDNWTRYMSATFRNHDVRQPAQGAQALVDWLKANPEFKSDYATSKGSAHPQLFVLAEGDLVFVLGSPEVTQQFDPAAQIGAMSGNVMRIENGKVAEWWHIGSSTQRAAAPTATGS